MIEKKIAIKKIKAKFDLKNYDKIKQLVRDRK